MNLINALITSSSQWNSSSGYSSGYSPTGVDESTLAGVFATLGVIIVIAGVLAILVLIANYKIMQKMGHDGYKGLIPVVNIYLMMEKIEVSTKWLLVFTFGSVVAAIPLIGWLVLAVAMVYFAVIYSMSLARSFGKSDGFGIGLLLLNPIFMCILGFGKSEFVGANPMHDAIFGKKEPSSSLATPIGSSENKDNNTVEPMVESMETEKPEEPVMTAETPAEDPVMTTATPTEEPVMTTEVPAEPEVNSEPTMEAVESNKEDTL